MDRPRQQLLDNLTWFSVRQIGRQDVNLGPQILRSRISGRRGQDIKEFLEILGLAIRVPDERDVGHAAVDLVGSGSERVPVVLLSSAFEGGSQSDIEVRRE
jgi:hypothetical protein